MFAIEEWAKARLEDIEVLSQKNRQPDEAPGVKLHLEMTVSNHMLSTIDGRLKGWLFERNEATPAKPVANRKKDNVTGTLDEVEPVSDLPNLSNVGKHVKTFKWAEIVSGLMARVRFATSELELDDASCGPFTIKPKEGGSCVLKFPLEAPNASEKVFAKLAKYKSREIELTAVQHGPASDAGGRQQSIDDSKDPAPEKKDTPDPKAPAGGKPDDKGENWPFPGDRSAQEQIEASAKKQANTPPPQSATTEHVPEKPRRGGRRVVTAME